MADFNTAHEFVKKREGGYQDMPNDTGNWVDGELIGTNWGISAKTLASYWGRTPTKQEMMDLPYSTALEIYQTNYWNRIKGDDIDNQSIALIIYDGAVNQGRGATRIVVGKALRSLGVDIENDDVFSDYGIEQINNQDSEELFNRIKEERIKRYKQGGNDDFLPGHLNRVSKISYSMLGSIIPNYTLPLIAVGVGVLSIIIVLLLDDNKQENYIDYGTR